MSTLVVDKVIEQLKILPTELQWRVFEFTRALTFSAPHGTLGRQLLAFAGTIPATDLSLIGLAIEKGCERVDANEWQIPPDTNIIIALFADDVAVKEGLGQADEVFIPSIVIGELCFGAHQSARDTGNMARIDSLATDSVVLGCDTETARRDGEIKSVLRIKGRPIPENDIWIAAIALQHDLTLVSRDARFGEIDGLRLVAW